MLKTGIFNETFKKNITNWINNCILTNPFAYQYVLMLFCSVPPDSPHEVAFSLFVFRGCPRAAQRTIDLVTIDLGHIQLDWFSTFYCLRYAISKAGKIAWPVSTKDWFIDALQDETRLMTSSSLLYQSTVKIAQNVRLSSRTCLSHNVLKSLKYIHWKWYKSYFEYWCRTFCLRIIALY